MQIPLSPSIVLAAAALTIVAGLFFRVKVPWIAGLALFVVATIAANIPGLPPFEITSTSVSAFVDDGLSKCEHWIGVAFSLLAAIAITDIARRKNSGLVLYGFLLFAFAGILFAVRSNDFITLGLSLEIVRRALNGFAKQVRFDLAQSVVNDRTLSESMASDWSSILESGLYWLGTALLASATASTNFDSIRSVLIAAYDPGGELIAIGAPSRLILLSVGLITASLLAQMGLLPFRLNFDVSNRQLDATAEGVVRVGSLLAASSALIRLYGMDLVGLNPALTTLLMTVCLVNFVASGLTAIRCLSPGIASIPYWLFSLVTLQNAWLLIGLMIASNELGLPGYRWGSFAGQIETTVLCILAQLSGFLAVAGFYWILGSLKRIDRGLLYLEDFRGLVRYEPVAAFSLIVATACAIGIPITIGFWSRWYTVLSGHSIHAKGASSLFEPNAGLRLTIFAGTVATAVAASAAFRLVREIAFESPLSRLKAIGGKGPLFSGTIAAVIILILGLVPQLVLIPMKLIGAPRAASPASIQRGSGHLPMGQRNQSVPIGRQSKVVTADGQ